MPGFPNYDHLAFTLFREYPVTFPQSLSCFISVHIYEAGLFCFSALVILSTWLGKIHNNYLPY